MQSNLKQTRIKHTNLHILSSCTQKEIEVEFFCQIDTQSKKMMLEWFEIRVISF
jgi:hypothetical protein